MCGSATCPNTVCYLDLVVVIATGVCQVFILAVYYLFIKGIIQSRLYVLFLSAKISMVSDIKQCRVIMCRRREAIPCLFANVCTEFVVTVGKQTL